MNLKTVTPKIVEARQISMFFMDKQTNLKPHLIGQFFSNKQHVFDRNTVSWSIKKVKYFCDTDKWFLMKFKEIEAKLKETNLN